ncbi:MAG: diguanylate cyclase [Chitinispirillia bacterium]|nr:diguanylate cyclase [Chitinispirillia bacterium]MCL2267584.1 diguanylate cyclase [Chitinispirillia bacterium]
METVNANNSAEHTILVVDDDPSICDLLNAALSTRYRVTVCMTGREALNLISEWDFDIIITDLMLPDTTGIDILAYAKSRDEFAEVLMITGNATVDSAAAAINHGVASYMLKPFSIPELRGRVEKMVASRVFHLRSLQLMNSSDLVDPAVRGHIDDVTSLYHFTRKLMLTLEIAEVMRIILEEVNNKAGANFSSLEIDLLDYREVYSMPMAGEAGREALDKIFTACWSNAFLYIDRDSFQKGVVQHYIYKGRQGQFSVLPEYKCVNYPLIVTGKSIGSLSVWLPPDRELEHRVDQYLHILTSITSPVIEHVYSDLHTRFQAKTDGLTGIPNHRHFYEMLEREIARTNRKEAQFALVLADIDNFKLINDTFGHQIGDEVLIELAKRLSANVRTGDLVARYGGEEFGIILTDTDLGGASILANRLCEAVASAPFRCAKNDLSCTASFGLAVYDGTKPINKGELIFKADQALYRSKLEGKNRVTVAEQSDG